ncbi:hypothetical protein [Desulfatitalea tepidiphila]|uniref:hypothetical protein n=1 Tax=Desulfatitalea tepidiphila TaxID=1185843 RepID=UPI0006B5920B|nr:hypothetical protein [Desulfatitalea tepidiphila]
MDQTTIPSQSQDSVHFQSKNDDFFGSFKIAPLMHRYGMADISFIEALCRILMLATDRLRQLGTFCEKTAIAFFDAIMDAALQCVGLSKNKLLTG